MRNIVKTRKSWQGVKSAHGGLTPKQRLFVREYVANGGNGTAAVAKVCSVNSRAAASAGATEFLRIPLVRQEIKRLLVPIEATDVSVLARLVHISNNAKADSTRLRAAQSIARVLGML